MREKQLAKDQREFCRYSMKHAKDATPKGLREHLLSLCKEKGYDPMEASIELRNELVEKVKGARKIRRDAGPKRIIQQQRYEIELFKLISGIDKDINRYLYPIIKSYDVQGEIQNNTVIKLIRYSDGKELDPSETLKTVEAEAQEVDIDMSEIVKQQEEAAKDGD